MLYEHWTQDIPAFRDNAEFTLVVNEDAGSQVPVTIQCNEVYVPGAGGFGIDWTMDLQRYEEHGGDWTWTTIGSREGYCHADSWSNRTFTNVAQWGQLRIVVHASTSQNYRRVESDVFTRL